MKGFLIEKQKKKKKKKKRNFKKLQVDLRICWVPVVTAAHDDTNASIQDGVIANGPGYLGSVTGRVIPKTLKIVLA